MTDRQEHTQDFCICTVRSDGSLCANCVGRLRAENERLRAALTAIYHEAFNTSGNGFIVQACLNSLGGKPND